MFLWRRFLIFLSALCVILVSVSLPVSAQTEAGQWRPFTSSDGLVDNAVNAVLQDHRGVMWFGTNAGVSRFDGIFTTIQDIPALQSGVLAIHETPDGALWFGANAGVVRYMPENGEAQVFTHADGLASDQVLAIAEDGQGRLWFGTTAGVSQYDPGTGAWTTFTTADGLSHDVVNVIAVSTDQTLWFGTEGGVTWYNPTKGQWGQFGREEGLAGDRVFDIQVDKTGNLWFGTDNGITRYHPFSGRWRTFTVADGLSANFVWSILEDTQGHLWFGTNSGGVSHYDPSTGKWEAWTTDKGLIANFVRDIWEDRDGGLWFATLGGVSLYTGRSWRTVHVGGLATVDITALLLDRHQRLWVATNNRGLWLYDGATWMQFSAGNGALGSNSVWSLYEDAEGNIWAGTGGGGVSLWDGQRWRIFTKRDGLAENYVTSIRQAPDGTMWFGTTQGASRFDPKTGEWWTLDQEAGLPGPRVNAIAITPEGEVWLGTHEHGICRYDGTQCHVFTMQDGLADDGVATGAVTMDNMGGLWFGHWRGGISHWNGETWERIGTVDGLAADRVYSLYWASDNSLWAGTLGGLSRYDGRSWQTYTRLNGLPSNEVTAIAEDPDGAFWLGTISGLAWHRPEHSSPWVKIRTINGRVADANSPSIPLDDVTIAPPDSRRVKAIDGNISIVYRGGDLWTDPSDLLYLYRLKGREDSWQVTREQLRVYEGLEPGEYIFEVMVRDLDFNYSRPERLTIEVPKQPFTVNVPFLGPISATGFGVLFAIAMMAVLGLGYGGVTYYNARSRPRQAIERKFNPYISGEPIRRADMFFGREELLRRILHVLHSNSIMIHGERRIGKTTMLHQIANQLRETNDPEYRYIPIYMDLEGTPQEVFFHTLMEEIIAETEPHLSERPRLQFDEMPLEEYGDREFTTDLRKLLAALNDERDPREVRLILLMDEMDIMNSYEPLVQQQLRRIFMQTFARNLGAVVAGIQISKEWDRIESPWYNLFNEIHLEPFTPEQARELIEEPVRGVYKWDKEAVEFVIEKGEGRPHRIQQYCLEAVNQMIEAGRSRITLEDVYRAHEIIQQRHQAA
ncbi:MAG TPA: AAA family ATPase [Caldilineae bacterium]|nr:AAA family ATPase [Caldilineae bacterium]